MSAAPKVPFVGLTGAIASGKSEALAAFERLGAATLSADAVVHELLAGERVRDLLVARWGPEIAPGGEIDRGRVGEIVFNQPDELAWLESTLHPLVRERIAAWRERLPPETPLAVVEVPLLFETGMDSAFDATVAIVAAPHLRAARARARGAAGPAGRDARQLGEAEKARRATHVIRNDGTLNELEAALAALLPKLGVQSAGRQVPERG